MKDDLGLALSGATAAGLAPYQAALDQFRCFTGDPAALVEQALEASPAMTMAHVFKAWLYLLGTEPAGIAVARACCDAAAALPSPAIAGRRWPMHGRRTAGRGCWPSATCT